MLINILQVITLLFQTAFVATSILGLPGNLISLIFPFIWWLSGHLTGMEMLVLTAMILVGEILEQGFGIITGKKAGLNKTSMIYSFIGAIVLGILMAPIMFGLGAFVGAFIGAFAGTFLYEYIVTKDKYIAFEKGVAALKGRFLGTLIKLALGISSIVMTTLYLF